MNQTTSPLTYILRIIGIILSLFLLSLASGLATASNRAETPALTALVRIDLSTPADLRHVAALDVPVYAYLHSPGGQAYLLALANAPQQKALTDQGLALRMLDPDSQGATYYVLTAFRPGAIDRARARVDILDEDGRQAVARATPDQVGQLPELGFELKRLGPDPIVLPLEEKVPAIPEAITPIPIIQGMIDQVYTATVYNYDAELSGAKAATIGGGSYTILNRNTNGGVPIQHAAQYVYEHFLADGLTTSYQLWNTINNPNVIGEQPGHSQASRIYLVTAHLDDMPNGPVAPGADDNASGSVGVLVAADILSQYDFDCTLRYIVFTGEEQGLLGSDAYAASVHNLGEDIAGVLNLDMIGYNTIGTSSTFELHTRPGNAGDLAIANLFVDVADAYNINLIPQIVQDGITLSDHASFWDYGFSAILGIEDFSDFTPYYHTTNDKIGTLDMNYFTWFVKAAVGTLAHIGCLPPPSSHLAGTVSDAQSSTPIQGATVKAMLSPDQAWANTSESDGSYDIALYPGVYTVTAQAPGYMLYSTAGISVTTDQTTTLDIALEVTPTLPVYLPILRKDTP